MAPLSTRVAATLANASERRSIAFGYQQTPIYHTPVTIFAGSAYFILSLCFQSIASQFNETHST